MQLVYIMTQHFSTKYISIRNDFSPIQQSITIQMNLCNTVIPHNNLLKKKDYSFLVEYHFSHQQTFTIFTEHTSFFKFLQTSPDLQSITLAAITYNNVTLAWLSHQSDLTRPNLVQYLCLLFCWHLHNLSCLTKCHFNFFGFS